MTILLLFSFFLLLVYSMSLLMYNKGNRKANLFIALFVLLLSIQNLFITALKSGWLIKHPIYAELDTPFLFLLPPVFYFVIKSIFISKMNFKIKHLWHILPALAIFAFYFPFYSDPATSKLEWLEKSINQLHPIKLVVLSIYNALFFIYLFYSLRLLKKIREREEEVSGLPIMFQKWLRQLSIFILIYFSALFFPIFISFGKNALFYIALINTIVATLMLLKVLVSISFFFQLQSTHHIITDSVKYSEHILDETDKNDIQQMIETYMNNSVLRDKENLSLTDLANGLKIPVNHITQVVFEKMKPDISSITELK